MKKNLKILIVSSIVVFFISCSNSQKKDNKNNIQSNEYKINTNIAIWQQDSLGCQHKRTKELSEKMIKSFSLENNSKTVFLKIFGKPNKIKKLNQELIFTYYFSSFCQENEFIDSLDYCNANYIFKLDTLVEHK